MRSRTLTAITLTVAVAGCGTQQPERPAAQVVTATPTTTPSPAGLTHRQFIQALNKSCRAHAAAIKRISEQGEAAITRGDLPSAGRAIQRLLPYIREHTRRASRLKPPPEDRDDFRAYLRAQRRFQGYGVRLVRALKADDYADSVRWSDLGNDARGDRATAAIDLGADKCGS